MAGTHVGREGQYVDPQTGHYVDPATGDIWMGEVYGWSPRTQLPWAPPWEGAPDRPRQAPNLPVMEPRDPIQRTSSLASQRGAGDTPSGSTSALNLWSVAQGPQHAQMPNLWGPIQGEQGQQPAQAGHPVNDTHPGELFIRPPAYDALRGDLSEARKLAAGGQTTVDNDPNTGIGSRYTDFKYYDELGQATNNPYAHGGGQNQAAATNPRFNPGTGRYDVPEGPRPVNTDGAIARSGGQMTGGAWPDDGKDYVFDIRTGKMIPKPTASADYRTKQAAKRTVRKAATGVRR